MEVLTKAGVRDQPDKVIVQSPSELVIAVHLKAARHQPGGVEPCRPAPVSPGLVARVVPAANLMDEAMKCAETIASIALVAVMTAKEAVNRAFETTLAEGILFERRTFQALFATHDQKEGMAAFIEKRPAKFENR